MWSTMYKGYYMQGYADDDTVIVKKSSSGFGYEWRKECKSLHAAKLAITKHIKESRKAKLQTIVDALENVK